MMLLSALVLIQGLHVAEHVVQTTQVFALGVPRPLAGGLLGSMFDFPWVHFAYNFAYWIGLLVVGLGLIAVGLSSFDRLGVQALLFATVLQGYHSLEHVAQIHQHLATGTQRPPGALGMFTDNVTFHFLLNAVVFLPALLAWWRFGGKDAIGNWVRRRAPAAT